MRTAFLLFMACVALAGCSDDGRTPATTGGAGGNAGSAGSPDGGSGGAGAVDGGGGRAGAGAAGGGSGVGGTGGTAGSAGDAGAMCVWKWQDWTQCPACAASSTCDGPMNQVNGDGTVSSSCCGLVWQRVPAPSVMTWPQAEAYCNDLDLAGAEWRLPTIAELTTLVYRGKDQPVIDTTAFPDTPTERFWSSSYWVLSTRENAYYTVDFYFGYTPSMTGDESARVRCVHGGGPAVTSGTGADGCKLQQPGECPIAPACAVDSGCAAATHTDNGDGTVASSCCGLTWQKAASPDDMYWRDARTYCETLALDGGGWRLPRAAELRSLVVQGQTPVAPTIDRGVFPDTPVEIFWSSSPGEGKLDSVAWVVDFETGSSYPADAMDFSVYHVRCVR
jgi:hypothetical protein